MGIEDFHVEKTSRRELPSYRLLNSKDVSMAQLLLTMLRDSPWPSADTRWLSIEAWAEDITRRTT